MCNISLYSFIHSLPEGPTAYVLRLLTTDTLIKDEILYNPVTGDSYHIRTDHDIPLYSIGMIFNHENIWINIQVEQHPQKISWTLHG